MWKLDDNKPITWRGTAEEGAELIIATDNNGTCWQYGSSNYEPLQNCNDGIEEDGDGICPAHQLLTSQRLLDGLLSARHRLRPIRRLELAVMRVPIFWP